VAGVADVPRRWIGALDPVLATDEGSGQRKRGSLLCIFF
jgi:hypothetical protein